MKREDFDKILGCVIFFGFPALALSLAIGCAIGVKWMREDAAKAGAGHWTIEKTTGSAKWVWGPPKE
jgi:hypothetical protein